MPKKGLELEPFWEREPVGEILSLAKDQRLVPKKGLEPPHPCGYMDLNHARLPIPPLRRVTFRSVASFAGRRAGRTALLFYRQCGRCQTDEHGASAPHRGKWTPFRSL